jgi:hypothetical protein
MLKNFLAILISLISLNSFATEANFIKAGLGLGTKNPADVKLITIGRKYEFFLLDYKLEVGGWSDSTGRTRSSGMGSFELGLEPRFRNWYACWFSGIGGITNRDESLGSFYQFFHSAGIGVKDYRGVGLGLHYKHISNAGIVQPNQGRDFLGVELRMPL